MTFTQGQTGVIKLYDEYGPALRTLLGVTITSLKYKFVSSLDG